MTPTPKDVPLPDAVQSALHAISRDLRNVPRDCIVDRAELFHWLRRQANRVDGVRDMKLIAPPKPPSRPALARPQTPREKAEALFSGPAQPERRTIRSRKGKTVAVEVRARQLEMVL